jgi:biotin---protein ligase
MTSVESKFTQSIHSGSGVSGCESSSKVVDDIVCVLPNAMELAALSIIRDRIQTTLGKQFDYKLVSEPSIGDEDDSTSLGKQFKPPRLRFCTVQQYVDEYAHGAGFNVPALLEALQDSKIESVRNRTIMYCERVTSTQTILFDRCFGLHDDIVFVAHQQVQGKGRGSNVWESPPGCLCFSFKTKLPDATLLPFMQYIVSLAMVKAVKRIAPDVKVQLKWPNDLYANDALKIGGVLCQSSYVRSVDNGNFFDVCIGLGINVSNALPTTCLNAMATAPDGDGDETHGPFTREKLLAVYLDIFETDMQEFVKNGFKPFEQEYLDSWMHSGQVLKLGAQPKLGNTECSVRIVGLTKDGYLRVQRIDNTDVEYELHPDGNRLNFLTGLIVHRQL